MSFIIRNLGWILLIGFFLFMLYIISNQNNIAKESVTQSGAIVVGTGSSKSQSIFDTNISHIQTWAITEEKNDFLWGLVEASKDNDNKQWKKVKIEKIVPVQTEKTHRVKTVITDKHKWLTTKIKNTKIKTITKQVVVVKKEKPAIIIPALAQKKIPSDNTGINQKIENIKNKATRVNSEKNTNIWTDHTVSSSFLRINNAYFTKKEGILQRGDVVKQLTNTNKYGCFKMKVLSAKKSAIWKTGWVCEYYMKWREETLSKYTTLKKIEKSKKVTKKIIYTKNQTLYNIKTHSLKINNAYFNHTVWYLSYWDTVQQIGSVNRHGCFKMKVVKVISSLQNRVGKIWWVCQKYVRVAHK